MVVWLIPGTLIVFALFSVLGIVVGVGAWVGLLLIEALGARSAELVTVSSGPGVSSLALLVGTKRLLVLSHSDYSY